MDIITQPTAQGCSASGNGLDENAFAEVSTTTIQGGGLQTNPTFKTKGSKMTDPFIIFETRMIKECYPMRFFACFLLSFCLLLSACDNGPSLAVVDVNTILISSPHAKKAEAESVLTQEIYQYNLNVIESKLSTYKNKPQAEAWLLEAARQLQVQLTTSRTAVTKAMVDALHLEINTFGAEYDVVLSKGGVLTSKPALDITADIKQLYDNTTIAWPPLPQRIDNPDLPADNDSVAEPEMSEIPDIVE